MDSGIFDLLWTLGNTILLLCIIYGIYQLLVKVPKRFKALEAKIDRIEKMLEDINS